jgi:hypothetical protein
MRALLAHYIADDLAFKENQNNKLNNNFKSEHYGSKIHLQPSMQRNKCE